MSRLKNCFMLAGTALLGACATPAPAPATLPAHPVTASVTTATEQGKVPEGYTKVFVNGEERYCRDDVDTGSRVRRVRVCYTAAQLKAYQDDTANSFMNQLQNRNGAAAASGAQSGMGMGRLACQGKVSATSSPGWSFAPVATTMYCRPSTAYVIGTPD
jgi:hypothetical protein